MSFYRKLEKLQNSEEAQGKIVIVKCGAFFVSIGRDAVCLSLLLGLNVNCLNIGVCKVGIPVKYMMKYIDELEKIGHSFLIYDYEKNRRKYILKYSFEGVSVEETDKCFDCKRCIYLKEHGFNNDFDIFEVLSKKQEEKNNKKYEILSENKRRCYICS